MQKKSKIPKVSPISKNVYCELLEVFEKDIKRVESLTGLDLSAWKNYHE
jgi:hypothetical protein